MNRFSKDYIKHLAERYEQGNLSSKEREDFFLWYTDINEVLDHSEAENSGGIKRRMRIAIDRGRISAGHVRYFPRLLAAAAALLVISLVGLTIFLWTQKQSNTEHVVFKVPEAMPGGNKALLITPEGQKIDLSALPAGTSLLKRGIHGIQRKNGELIYHPQLRADNGSGYGNTNSTVVTPNGGQYQIVLSDGTRVWLNAASSISYPEIFSPGSRTVSLEGEAYFEVAHDKKRPFIVNTKLQQIRVLGTKFNISAYKDEPATLTTLVEGRVDISSGSNSQILNPGFQAMTIAGRNGITTSQANPQTALAWKNGLFVFDEDNLPTIMRQISRWYNIRVHLVGKPGNAVFSGGLSRQSKLSTLLEILRANHIVFSMHNDGKGDILEVQQ